VFRLSSLRDVTEHDDREAEESAQLPSGEANMPGIEEKELPNPAKLAKKLVEEREAGGGEEGAALSEEEPGDES
jgi:hypothetical protein